MSVFYDSALLRWPALAAVVLFSACLHAAEDDKYAPVRDKLATCVVCHGERGASKIPQNPVLAGQHLHYLYVQLKDFKAGRRASPIMQPLAATLGKEEMLLMAEYFSEQEWADAGFKATPEQIEIGRKVVSAGQCVQCHLGGFEGGSGVPREAGQHYDYLVKTMLDFKNRIRNNSPAKNTLLSTFSEEQITAVSAYLSSLNN